MGTVLIKSDEPPPFDLTVDHAMSLFEQDITNIGSLSAGKCIAQARKVSAHGGFV